MIKKILNGEAKAVSRIVKGVKSECRLELDGSENWRVYNGSAGWVGVWKTTPTLSSKLYRTAHYSNYFGFTEKGNNRKYLWVGVGNAYLYLVWLQGFPPVGYEHWEKDGVGDVAAVKADLQKRHLIIWYDRTNSSVASMSALIPLIARDTEKVKKVVDVTDQMTNSKGNHYWNAENQEWTGADKEYCYVGNVVGIIDKYGLQKYVIEFDARTDVEGSVNVYDTSGNKYKYTFINETFTCKKEWQHYKFTGKAKLGVDGGHECNISFYSVYGTGVIPHIKNFKIRTSVDVFTHVMSEVADGVVELNPAEVADGLLTIKGDNAKVENNKLIIQ